MKPGLFKKAGCALSFLALFTMLGAHWHVLQSVAWARMLVSYSRTDTLSSAIGKTFDGKHPCAMCLQIRSGRHHQEQEQKKLPLAERERGPDLLAEDKRAMAPGAPKAAWNAVPLVPSRYSNVVNAPPKPPPRAQC